MRGVRSTAVVVAAICSLFFAAGPVRADDAPSEPICVGDVCIDPGATSCVEPSGCKDPSSGYTVCTSSFPLAEPQPVADPAPLELVDLPEACASTPALP